MVDMTENEYDLCAVSENGDQLYGVGRFTEADDHHAEFVFRTNRIELARDIPDELWPEAVERFAKMGIELVRRPPSTETGAMR